MPLPKASNAQEKEYLDRLYDEYCKIAFKAFVGQVDRSTDVQDLSKIMAGIAKVSHGFADAMLNERTK